MAKEKPALCTRCEWKKPTRRSPIDKQWVCGTDHNFEWRTGRVRTEEEIVQHGRRVAEKLS